MNKNAIFQEIENLTLNEELESEDDKAESLRSAKEAGNEGSNLEQKILENFFNLSLDLSFENEETHEPLKLSESEIHPLMPNGQLDCTIIAETSELNSPVSSITSKSSSGLLLERFLQVSLLSFRMFMAKEYAVRGDNVVYPFSFTAMGISMKVNKKPTSWTVKGRESLQDNKILLKFEWGEILV